MKKLYITILLVCLTVPLASAADKGFVTTSEGIVRELTQKPNAFGATRSFVVRQDKTRSITVRFKKKGHVQNSTVTVHEHDPVGVARLKVEFDVDSARLRPGSYEILDQLGVALADTRIAGRGVCIKGHTDSDGTDAYNLRLSYERADAVRDYVIAHDHLKPFQLFVVGYGEEMPLAGNDSQAHKQRNRRVEITLGCPEVAGR